MKMKFSKACLFTTWALLCICLGVFAILSAFLLPAYLAHEYSSWYLLLYFLEFGIVITVVEQL